MSLSSNQGPSVFWSPSEPKAKCGCLRIPHSRKGLGGVSVCHGKFLDRLALRLVMNLFLENLPERQDSACLPWLGQ